MGKQAGGLLTYYCKIHPPPCLKTPKTPRAIITLTNINRILQVKWKKEILNLQINCSSYRNGQIFGTSLTCITSNWFTLSSEFSSEWKDPNLHDWIKKKKFICSMKMVRLHDWVARAAATFRNCPLNILLRIFYITSLTKHGGGEVQDISWKQTLKTCWKTSLKLLIHLFHRPYIYE